MNDPGPRLGKDLQALSIRRPFHMPSSVKSSDALRNGAQPCSGVLLPMSNLFAEICRAFIYLVRQCADTSFAKGCEDQVSREAAEDLYLKSFWNIYSWPHPITYSHRKLSWKRFCETRTAQNLAILGTHLNCGF